MFEMKLYRHDYSKAIRRGEAIQQQLKSAGRYVDADRLEALLIKSCNPFDKPCRKTRRYAGRFVRLSRRLAATL